MSELEFLKNRIANYFLNFYCLQKISQDEKIVKIRSSKVSSKHPKGKTFNGFASNHTSTQELIIHLREQQSEMNCSLLRCASEWTNPHKLDWLANTCTVYGKAYEKIQNTKFCQKSIFEIFAHLGNLNPTQNERFYDVLMQDRQSYLLDMFIEKSASISEDESFEFKEIPLLSRFSVGTLWSISLLFHQVTFHNFHTLSLSTYYSIISS